MQTRCQLYTARWSQSPNNTQIPNTNPHHPFRLKEFNTLFYFLGTGMVTGSRCGVSARSVGTHAVCGEWVSQSVWIGPRTLMGDQVHNCPVSSPNDPLCRAAAQAHAPRKPSVSRPTSRDMHVCYRHTHTHPQTNTETCKTALLCQVVILSGNGKHLIGICICPCEVRDSHRLVNARRTHSNLSVTRVPVVVVGDAERTR
jgi:hypothetical protein